MKLILIIVFITTIGYSESILGKFTCKQLGGFEDPKTKKCHVGKNHHALDTFEPGETEFKKGWNRWKRKQSDQGPGSKGYVPSEK